MIQLVRQQPVPTRVTREKINAPSIYFAADDRIRGIAKGRRDLMLPGIAEAFDLIQAAAADNANRCVVHFHFECKISHNDSEDHILSR